MQSGKLKEKITIERQTQKKDEYGAKIKAYEKVYAAKGNVVYLSGSELIKAGVSTNTVVISVKMRSDKRMTYSSFLIVDGERFEVTGIRYARNKREFYITALREV